MDAVCGSDLQCPVRGHRRRQESAGARCCGDWGLATIGCDRRVRRGVLPPRACGAAAHVIGVRRPERSRLPEAEGRDLLNPPATRAVNSRRLMSDMAHLLSRSYHQQPTTLYALLYKIRTSF